MLTILIGGLAFVALFAAAGNGEWGSFWLGIGIVVLLMLCSHEEREDRKAMKNARDYWAKGGVRK